MIGVQGILANNSNVVNDATITASNVKAVANSVRRLSTLRQGNGLAALTGSYSGAADSIIDVEIIDEIATAPIISKPSFSGQGSGTLDDVTFTGSAQAFTVELADLGAVLTTAAANLDSVKVISRVAGAVGNAISLTVDESTLVFTATAYSLIEDLKLGTKATESNGFDWQSVVVGPDKVIPTTAKRVVFGTDHSNIYLQYKTYEKGNWVYNFEPAIKRDVPKGTPVFFVTGGRIVTATDTITPEVYTGIISLYDLLAAIQTTSVLLKVEGVVANDRHPGGQGVKELNLRTDAFMAENNGSGSVYATGFEDVIVGSNAYTEIIEARCYAIAPQQAPAARLGAELWELRGSVSGLLDAALATNILFTELASRFALRIPQRLPAGFSGARGRFSIAGISYASRVAPAVPPPICVVALTLGPGAFDQQITLRYIGKPSMTCECASMPVPDLSGNFCITGVEGGTTLSDIQTRIVTAYAWRKAFDGSLYDGEVLYTDDTATADRVSIEQDFQSFMVLLKQLSGGAPADLDNWDDLWNDFVNYADATLPGGVGGGSGVAVTEQILVSAVGFEFELAHKNITSLVIKDSAGTPATLALTTNYTADLAHGRVSFVSLAGFVSPFVATYNRTVGNYYVSKAENVLGQVVSVPYGVGGLNISNFRVKKVSDNTIVSNTNYTIDAVSGTITWSTAPTTFATDASQELRRPATIYREPVTGVYYMKVNTRVPVINTLQPFTAAAVIYNENGVDVTTSFYMGGTIAISLDQDCYIALAVSPYVMANIGRKFYVSIDLVDTAIPAQYLIYEFNTTSAGAVSTSGTSEVLNMDAYDDRRQSWPSWRDNILAIAGKFDAGSSAELSGDGCWREYNDAFFWEVTGSVGGEYQNAYNNRPYYSSKNSASTHEFAFQINVNPKCLAELMVGDTVTLSIGDAGLPATYQVGDSLILSTVAAQPLQLAGGVNGDNTQTWHVSGSVDGALPAYPLVTTAPTAYSESGLDFIINPGAVPFDKGDKFDFTVEGGHWRWRKDGAAYSAAAEVTLAPVALADGLSLTFTTGITPSFRTGDIFSYRVTQPYNPVNVKRPTPLFWRWDGAGAVLTMLLGVTKPITALAMLHRLPVGATVLIEGGVGSYTWTESFTAVAGQNLLARFVSYTADRLRTTVALATDGAIDWLWAGAELTTEYSAEVSWQRDYKLERGAGFNPGAIYLGKAGSGEFSWDELTEVDRVKIEALLDHVKQHGDEPAIFFPQRLRPSEAMLARIIPDQIDLADIFAYQPDEAAERHYSVTMPLQGVFL